MLLYDNVTPSLLTRVWFSVLFSLTDGTDEFPDTFSFPFRSIELKFILLFKLSNFVLLYDKVTPSILTRVWFSVLFSLTDKTDEFPDTFSLLFGLIELKFILLCVLVFCLICQILCYFMTTLPLFSLLVFDFRCFFHWLTGQMSFLTHFHCHLDWLNYNFI